MLPFSKRAHRHGNVAPVDRPGLDPGFERYLAALRHQARPQRERERDLRGAAAAAGPNAIPAPADRRQSPSPPA